jgi:hypothetical protein
MVASQHWYERVKLKNLQVLEAVSRGRLVKTQQAVKGLAGAQ